jgi:hypothetical protein
MQKLKEPMHPRQRLGRLTSNRKAVPDKPRYRRSRHHGEQKLDLDRLFRRQGLDGPNVDPVASRPR